MIVLQCGVTRVGSRVFRNGDVFEADDAVEKRLVDKGAAAYAVPSPETAVAIARSGLDEANGGVAAPEAEGVLESDSDGIVDEVVYDESNTVAELRGIADAYGVSLPSKASKAFIISALDAHFGKKLGAEEPIV